MKRTNEMAEQSERNEQGGARDAAPTKFLGTTLFEVLE